MLCGQVTAWACSSSSRPSRSVLSRSGPVQFGSVRFGGFGVDISLFTFCNAAAQAGETKCLRPLGYLRLQCEGAVCRQFGFLPGGLSFLLLLCGLAGSSSSPGTCLCLSLVVRAATRPPLAPAWWCSLPGSGHRPNQTKPNQRPLRVPVTAVTGTCNGRTSSFGLDRIPNCKGL